MNWLMEYTADSTPLLKEWRRSGSAPEGFLDAVRKHCIYEGICWRGTSLRSLSEYSPVLSSSRNIAIADHFTSYHCEAAIVAFVGYEAYDISHESVYPNEGEVIIIMPKKKKMFNPRQVAWLEGIPVYLTYNSDNAENLLLWEKEVKYQVARYQSFLNDYDL